MSGLTELLSQLTPLFANEPRPGGAAAARALYDNASKNPSLYVPDNPVNTTTLAGVFKHQSLPEIKAQKDTILALDWHYSGLSDGRIREDIARHMLTCEIIGPTGMLTCDHLKVGLFFQEAGLDYVTRVHAAEETFVMLAGQAFWSVDDGPLESRSAGDVIFHPSMAPHKSVTDKAPLLAAWRWTGEIDYGLYTLTG